MEFNDSESVEQSGCELALTDRQVAELSERPIHEEVEIFSTIGSDTRYRILLILHEAADPVCVCELEPHLEVGQSSISQSLSRLRKAGLVTRSKEGRWRYYEPTALADQFIAVVESALSEEEQTPAL